MGTSLFRSLGLLQTLQDDHRLNFEQICILSMISFYYVEDFAGWSRL